MKFKKHSMQKESRVLVTGANGFVGRHLCAYFEKYQQIQIRKAIREDDSKKNEAYEVGDICGTTYWGPILSEINCVVHLAGLVHVLEKNSANPLASFRVVNVDGTINLARQAVRAGVKRFIFLSSIKVNGEKTEGNPFCADDTPAPSDPYSMSKFEAEKALFRLGKKTGLEVVVIRPPMVYGPAAKGNFSRLVWLVQNMKVLPFGNVKNKRSLLYVNNLCDLILHCIYHEKAAGQVITACDTHDLSTPELIHLIAKCLHTKCYLFPMPINLLLLWGQLLGKNAEISRLTESLQIDHDEVKRKIGWHPPVKVNEAFIRSIVV